MTISPSTPSPHRILLTVELFAVACLAIAAQPTDGVTDPIAWSTGRGDEALTLPFTTRLNSHRGAQETLNEFFRLCDQAGSGCAFSGEKAARFAALAQRARQAPVKFDFPDLFTGELDY